MSSISREEVLRVIKESYEAGIVSREDINSLLGNTNLQIQPAITVHGEKVVEVAQPPCQEELPKAYPITVRCSDLTLLDMIKKTSSKYVDPLITFKWFPIGTKTYETKFYLFEFTERMTYKEVLETLNEYGMRPAKIEELLAFHMKYKYKSRIRQIVAFDSAAWFGHYYNIVVLQDESLLLRPCFFEMDVFCVFAAVPK